MDTATPNLPSHDFDATERFYRKLGFETQHRSDHWMILARDGAMLEFFHFPGLDPYASDFSCSVRLDDLEAMVEQCVGAGIPRRTNGIPRIVPQKRDDSGVEIAFLVDEDGTLLRLIQKPAE